MKIFFISFFLPFYLHSSTFDIKAIQEDFYNKVVFEPLYLQRYNIPLDAICEWHTEQCYKIERDKLELDPSTEILLKKRDAKFTLDERYWNLAQKHLWNVRENFSSSQFLTLVDLSKQVLILVLWDNEKETFYPIGFDFISGGNMDKEMQVINGDDHYLKTPAGLFSIQSGWRSDGKILEDNITMPYGKKDRFVFYFGKQMSVRYNTFDKNGTKILDASKWQLITDELELAIHAHKSTTSFGRAHSHGCIRMTNELNIFLDNNLVFFKNFYNENNEWLYPDKKQPSEPKNHKLSGEYMLVIDKL